MKVSVVQLSDIHFKEKPTENSLPSRVNAIADAVLSISRASEGVLIITSGDVAFSGKDAEYAIAKVFYTNLTDRLITGGVPRVIHECIPGNHDCDLTLARSARGTATQALLSSGNNGDGSHVETCIPVQTAFFKFRAELCHHPVPTNATDALITSVMHDIAGIKCEIHLLNTAFCSTKVEKPGQLAFPQDLEIPKQAGEPPTMVIGVLHHPYNWLAPSMAHALRDKLESACDLVLTGHEHSLGAHHNTDLLKDATLDYLEAPVLQDNSNPLNSGFNCIIYDIDTREQAIHLFEWNEKEKAYHHNTEPIVSDSLRNRHRLAHVIQLVPSFGDKLDDPGISFSHPNCGRVTLGALYVYPDLQPFDVKVQTTRGNICASKNVPMELLAQKATLVLGSTQSGKTALSKSLVQFAMSTARVPILMNGTDIESISGEALRKLVERKIREAFGASQSELFWQQPTANRVLVIDDYHKCRLNSERKTIALEYFEREFGCVVLVGNNNVRLNELLDSSNESEKLWTYPTFQIEEMTLSLRHALIEKWVSLRDGNKLETSDLEQRFENIERTVTTVFGNDLVPSFPVYVLLILQQLTGKSQASAVTGSFGYLYEVLLTDGLSSRELQYMNLDGKYTYLSLLAWKILNSEQRVLSNDEFRSWHNAYTAEFNSLVSFGDALEHFQALNILFVQDGEIQFRYPYIFAFFVALYIRDHLADEGMNAFIAGLSKKLYHDESARIVLFLCHHVKSPFLLDILIQAAGNIFPGKVPADLGQKEVLFLSTLQPKILVIDTSKTVKENRCEYLNGQDAGMRREQLARREESAEKLQLNGTGQLSEAAEITAAFKAIQILGQVVRNFSGSLTGAQQEELIGAIYDLGCRAMKVTLDAIELRNEELVKRLMDVFTRLIPRAPKDRELQDLAQLLVERVAEYVIGGLVRHVADSAGSSELETAIDHVLAQKDSNAVHLIDLAIRLDHYKEFPMPQVKEVHQRIRKIPFDCALFNNLLYRAFYLFPRTERLRQEIAARYGLRFERKVFDNNRKKRIVAKGLLPPKK